MSLFSAISKYALWSHKDWNWSGVCLSNRPMMIWAYFSGFVSLSDFIIAGNDSITILLFPMFLVGRATRPIWEAPWKQPHLVHQKQTKGNQFTMRPSSRYVERWKFSNSARGGGKNRTAEWGYEEPGRVQVVGLPIKGFHTTEELKEKSTLSRNIDIHTTLCHTVTYLKKRNPKAK